MNGCRVTSESSRTGIRGLYNGTRERGPGSIIYQWSARLPDPAQSTIINIKSLIAHELHAKPQTHRNPFSDILVRLDWTGISRCSENQGTERRGGLRTCDFVSKFRFARHVTLVPSAAAFELANEGVCLPPEVLYHWHDS